MAEIRRLDININVKNVGKSEQALTSIEKSSDKVAASMEKADKSVTTFSASAKNLGSVLKGSGALLTASLSAPLILLGKTFLDDVSNIEQFKVSLDTMLGSAEEGSRILNDFQEFAAKTPFTLTGVVESGKQLLAFGIEADNVLGDLKALGDIAAGTGGDLARLTLNFGQVATQGKLTGRELRDFAVNGIPLVDELANSFGVAREEIQDMVSAGKVGFEDVRQAFDNMTSDGGKFFDLMDKQSQTLGGILSNIRDSLTRVALSLFGLSTEADTFGQIIEGGIFDRLKDSAQGVLNSMEVLVDIFSELPVGLRTAIVGFTAFLAVLGPILLISGGVVSSLGAISAGLAGFSLTIGAILGPISLFVGALVGLGIVLKQFLDESNAQFDKSNENLKSQLNAFQEFNKNHFEKRIDIQKKAIDTIIKEEKDKNRILSDEEVKSALDRIKVEEEKNVVILKEQAVANAKYVQAQAEFAKDSGGIYDAKNNKIISQEAKFFKDLANDFKNGFKLLIRIVAFAGKVLFAPILSALKGVAKGIVSVFKGIGNSIKKALKGDFKGALSSAGNIFLDFGKNAIDVGKDTAKSWDSSIDTLIGDFKRLGNESIKAKAIDTFDLTGALDEITKGSTAKVKELEGKLENFGEDAGSSLGSGITKGIKKQDGEVKLAFDNIVDFQSEQEALKRTLSDTSLEVEDLGKAWEGGYLDVENALKSLDKAHEQSLGKITKELDDVVNKLKEVRQAYANESAKNLETFAKNAAQTIAQAEKAKQDIEKQISDLQASASGGNTQEQRASLNERIKALKSELSVQKDIISQRSSLEKELEIDLTDEIQKAREFRDANDLERIKIKFDEEKLLRLAQFQEEEQQLLDRQIKLEELKSNEINLYNEKRDTIQAIEANITEIFLTNLATREASEVATIDRLIQKYLALAAAKAKAGYSTGGFTGGNQALAVAQFARGGFTGSGKISDVAGVVHKGEWVAPSWLIKKMPQVFRSLEKTRNQGFASGGFTSPQSSTKNFNQPITINATSKGGTDFNSVARYLSWQLRNQ